MRRGRGLGLTPLYNDYKNLSAPFAIKSRQLCTMEGAHVTIQHHSFVHERDREVGERAFARVRLICHLCY